jgi:hypothetical protein
MKFRSMICRDDVGRDGELLTQFPVANPLLKLGTDVLRLHVQNLCEERRGTIELCKAVNIVVVDVAFGKNRKACDACSLP